MQKEKEIEKPQRKNSEARLRANAKYQTEKVDRVVFYVPKGMKERIKAKADALGVSPNKFILDLISAAMGEE